MSSDDIVLSIRNVSKCFEMYEKPVHRLFQTLCAGRRQFYKEFWALREINFEVRRGECVGIVGRNGAGKSTLLQIITGTLRPTTGTVESHGRIAALLELGSGFNPEFTGRENVYMNAAILGLTKAETDAKYQDIVDFADIGEFIDQPVKTYSSGMMVRLAFAVNVITEPDILIVDEALAVGDIAFQAKCFKRIKSLLSQRKTILFVSHDMGSVAQYCSTVHLLDHGQCIASGGANEIINRYKILMARESASISVSEAPADKENAPLPTPQKDEPIQSLPIAKETLEYGDHKVKIQAYRILDAEGHLTTQLIGTQTYRLQMDLTAAEAVESPILAFTIRDTAGNKICGTNTHFLNVEIPMFERGKTYRAEFLFTPLLQTKGYLLLLGCTEFSSRGLVVHHRLYDVCTLAVENTQRFNGFFACPVSCTISEVNE